MLHNTCKYAPESIIFQFTSENWENQLCLFDIGGPGAQQVDGDTNRKNP